MSTSTGIAELATPSAVLADDIHELLQAIDRDLPVLWLDADLRLRHWSRRAGELFHIDPGDVGRKIGLCCSDLRPRTIIDDSIRALTTGREVLREVDASSGERFLMRIWPVRRGDETTGVVVVLRDITRRKRAEAEAARAISQRDEYLATLAHDLRGPLMAILTAAEMLTADECHPQRQRRAADVIARQASRLSGVLDDLLDLSRRRDQEAELDLQRIDLCQVVAGAVAAAEPQARASGVVLRLRNPDTPLWIDGDSTLLGEAVAELIDNAIRVSAEGKRVRVSTHRQGAVATVIVTDEGVGIEPVDLAHMFEAVHPGLAQVRTVARAHGGDAGVESGGVGRGAEFTIAVPVTRPS